MSHKHTLKLHQINKQRTQHRFVFGGKTDKGQDVTFFITVGPVNPSRKSKLVPYQFVPYGGGD